MLRPPTSGRLCRIIYKPGLSYFLLSQLILQNISGSAGMVEGEEAMLQDLVSKESEHLLMQLFVLSETL